MPRYLVERVWDPMDEVELNKRAAYSKEIIENQFTEIVWEMSHVVSCDDGAIRSYCVFNAPDVEYLREHSSVLGSHRIDRISEIVGEISPADFPG